MIERLASRELQTRFGSFTEILYRIDGIEAIALVKGDVPERENVLCRVHSACIGGHVFNSVECTCALEMTAAQSAIEAEGRGVIVYLHQEGRGNGHLALMLSIPFKKSGLSQGEAYIRAGYAADARSYVPAAEILRDLHVESIILLTDNPAKASGLERLGVKVSSMRDISSNLSQNT